MAHYDDMLQAVRGGKYAECTYEVFTDANLTTKEVKGLYIICDGGYHRWRVLQCPQTLNSDPKVALWSRWMESVRKDVECTFGILKRRFRCLKLPVQWHHKDDVGKDSRQGTPLTPTLPTLHQYRTNTLTLGSLPYTMLCPITTKAVLLA